MGSIDGVNGYQASSGIPTRLTDPYGFFSTDLHNTILTRAFTGVLSTPEVGVLKEASAYVDNFITGQSRRLSYQHAMRGAGQSVAAARALYEEYLVDQLARAADTFNMSVVCGWRTREDASLFELGQGMHALMDSHSAYRSGFEVWNGLVPNTTDLVGFFGRSWDHHVNEDRITSDDPMVLAAQASVYLYYHQYRSVVQLGKLSGYGDPERYRALARMVLGAGYAGFSEDW
jgi:hypothetical protein